MSLYKEFKSTKRAELQKILKKKNIHEVPVVDKVVISMWIWSLATRKWVKDFSDLEKNLATIAGQKPNVIKSRKSISNFKLRENMPVMLRVTLRREKAYDFIERFVKLVLPRVRDFNWISPRKFDWKWNLNLWYPNQSIFAELNPEEIVTSQWVQINISTTTTVDVEAKELLKVLWIIFIEK